MDFTLKELKILTSAIITEIIRIEDKKHLSENDKERIKVLYDLGDRIDAEKSEDTAMNIKGVHYGLA